MPHCWKRPICIPGLLLELLGILTESNILPFFEHNMRFFFILFRNAMYSTQLVSVLLQAYNASIFRVFVNFR